MNRGELRRATDGGQPRWPTTVRVGRTNSALRVRFECVDERAWGSFEGRDEPLWQEEVVEVFLAPGVGDPKVYCEIEVNPLGALFDARVVSPHGERSTMAVDPSWDWPGIIWRAGRLDEREDWWAELTLPWQGLGLEAEPSCWRANFYRVERPTGAPGPADEYSAWAPTFAEPADFHRPRSFGLLLTEEAADLGSFRQETERPCLVMPRC